MAVITIIFFKYPKTGTLLTRISWNLNCCFTLLNCLIRCIYQVSLWNFLFWRFFVNKEKYPLVYKHWLKNLFWNHLFISTIIIKKNLKGLGNRSSLYLSFPNTKQQATIYSQTCIKRSLLGQRKSGLIRQVTS